MIRSSMKLTDFTKKARDMLHTKRKENLLRATVTWHAAVIEELTGARTGKEYNVPGTGSVSKVQITTSRGHKMTVRKLQGAKRYRASKPGEAPASRLGQLRQSYRFRVVGPNYMEEGEVGSPLDRALWLEEGTESMAPRPHLQKAFDSRRKDILNILKSRLDGGG